MTSVPPVFWATTDELRCALRASGIPRTSDAYCIFELSIAAAGLKLYQKLGDAKMAALLATAEVCPPITSAQRERLQAKIVESDLVLLEMLCRLPFASLDGSGGMDEWFDKEAPFRLMGDSERETLTRKLQNGVDEALGVLGAEESLNGPSCAVLGPERYHCDPTHYYHRPGSGCTRFPWFQG